MRDFLVRFALEIVGGQPVVARTGKGLEIEPGSPGQVAHGSRNISGPGTGDASRIG